MLALLMILTVSRSFGGQHKFGGGSFGGGRVQTKSFKFGKYFKGMGDYSDNTYWCFVPNKYEEGKKYPLVIDIHGGGFTMGSAMKTPMSKDPATINAADYVGKGMIVCSLGYRLVTTKYFYKDSNGNNHVEEFLKVDGKGRITIDSSKIITDYKVKVGRQEFMTKCIYDAVQAFEHILTKSNLPIDPHNIGFYSVSAGTAEAAYLTWTYPKWNKGRYTVKGFMGSFNQLDYPVQNILEPVWSIFAKDTGTNGRLAGILSQKDCGKIVGNPWCSQRSDIPVCNEQWNDHRMQKYCGPNFGSVTLGEIIQDPTSTWQITTKQDKGLYRLWCTSCQIKDADPNPDLHVYIDNPLSGTDWMSVVHNARFAIGYADLGDKYGYQYTVKYQDFPGMSPSDRSGGFGGNTRSKDSCHGSGAGYMNCAFKSDSSAFVSFRQDLETDEVAPDAFAGTPNNSTQARTHAHGHHSKKSHNKKSRKTNIEARRLFF